MTNKNQAYAINIIEDGERKTAVASPVGLGFLRQCGQTVTEPAVLDGEPCFLGWNGNDVLATQIVVTTSNAKDLVCLALDKAMNAAPKVQIADGLHRVEFVGHDGEGATVWLELSVIDGNAKGLILTETLRFGGNGKYSPSAGADAARIRAYSRLFDIGHTGNEARREVDPDEYLFRPFVAEIVGGVIVSIAKAPEMTYLPFMRPANDNTAAPRAAWTATMFPA